ncbi:MAG: 16S rRNA (uracil(1498)-N(3))-methyltransferase [Herpetosiphonaceae bacterium]|nr:16S rRNA (uracil(1498)-N(3))-methyltransferase [Herpetosiphonaceae bacterium]
MKNTYRFFVPPASISGASVQIEDREILHQWISVLRLRPGQQIALLDGSGRGYSVELATLDKRAATGRVLSEYAAQGEPGFAVVLYVALTRGERFEWVLQKGTELGATRFVPIIAERSQAEASANKRDRWLRIIREAAEQSGRGVLPELEQPLPFSMALGRHPQGIFLSEGPTAVAFKRALAAQPADPIALWSGPEGGWSASETQAAGQAGLIVASLGTRILRAETAPIAALAALMFARDEWILPDL